MSLAARTIRLPLQQRPQSDWLDARTTAGPRKPYIIQGCAARLELALFDEAGTALVSPSGLTLITMEVYAKRVPGAPDTTLSAIIAPAVFSGTLNTGLVLNDWNAGGASNCHFAFNLTGTQTNIADLSDDAAYLEGWLEIYGTLSGERKLLGSGPLIIERSAAGGTPSDPIDQYYTAAQVDALIAAGGGSGGSGPIMVTAGIAYVTVGATLYAFPVSTGASGAGADTDISVTAGIASFVYNDVTYSFPVSTP